MMKCGLCKKVFGDSNGAMGNLVEHYVNKHIRRR
jgi:hypothetical protein